MNAPLGRSEIIEVLTERLQAIDSIDAMWEIGAVAFGRIDDYSDIDLMISGHDDKIEEIISDFERILNQVSPIELMWRIPGTVEHGHTQIFCRLLNTSPFLLIDVVFMKSSAEQKYLVPEIHNPPFVYFDKAGIVKDEPFDADQFVEDLKAHAAKLKTKFELFQPLVIKEIHRGHAIEAKGYYQNACSKFLLDLFKIKYSPTRYNFGVRYVYDELPPDVLHELETVYFVTGLADLKIKQMRAEALFNETYNSLDWDKIGEIVRASSQRS